MANPLTPFVVKVSGSSASAAGDNVRITVYNGSTAVGSLKTILDSSKNAVIDFANSDVQVSIGDTLVATIYGLALAGTSVTVDQGGAEISLTSTTTAFPSRSL